MVDFQRDFACYDDDCSYCGHEFYDGEECILDTRFGEVFCDFECYGAYQLEEE